jgi:hypothetical protein
MFLQNMADYLPFPKRKIYDLLKTTILLQKGIIT